MVFFFLFVHDGWLVSELAECMYTVALDWIYSGLGYISLWLFLFLVVVAWDVSRWFLGQTMSWWISWFHGWDTSLEMVCSYGCLAMRPRLMIYWWLACLRWYEDTTKRWYPWTNIWLADWLIDTYSKQSFSMWSIDHGTGKSCLKLWPRMITLAETSLQFLAFSSPVAHREKNYKHRYSPCRLQCYDDLPVHRNQVSSILYSLARVTSTHIIGSGRRRHHIADYRQ
jgi:hypothetical protein